MKASLCIFYLLLYQFCWGNMGSPYIYGTQIASPFSSHDFDVTSEKIHIKINDEFHATYLIEYTIQADTAGIQIPLLFYAADYQDSFKVWVDNQEVSLIEIPYTYPYGKVDGFSDFSSAFHSQGDSVTPQKVVIYWEENTGYHYNIQDLKYFKIDLTKGEHLVKVIYTANAWTYMGDWVNQYTFRYSLYPAKTWRSFGTLEVTLDASSLSASISTNLGTPSSGDPGSVATWKFSFLPVDFIIVEYVPQVSWLGKFMIGLGPIGLTLIAGVVMGCLHFLLLRKYRRKYPGQDYTWPLIGQCCAISFILLLTFMLSFEAIDLTLEPHAGGYHGYTFLVFLLYPVVTLAYWVIIWGSDKFIKRKIILNK